MEITDQVVLDLAKSMETIAKTNEQYPLAIQDLAETLQAQNSFLSKLVSKQDEEDEKDKSEKDEEEMVSKVMKALSTIAKQQGIKEEAAKKVKPGDEQETIQGAKKFFKKQEEDEDEDEKDKEEKSMKKQEIGEDKKEEEDEEENLSKAKLADIIKSTVRLEMKSLKDEIRKDFGWVKGGVSGPKVINDLARIQSDTAVKKSEVPEEQYEMDLESLKGKGFREISVIEEKARKGEVLIKGFNC